MLEGLVDIIDGVAVSEVEPLLVIGTVLVGETRGVEAVAGTGVVLPYKRK